MGFFSDDNLDAKAKLQKRKKWLIVRYAACAYFVYLAYSLFTTPDEASDVSPAFRIIVPIGFVAAAIVIAFVTYKDQKRLDKRIEEENAKEKAENSKPPANEDNDV